MCFSVKKLLALSTLNFAICGVDYSRSVKYLKLKKAMKTMCF